MSDNPHAMAVAQLSAVAEILRSEYSNEAAFTAIIEKLKQPDRILEADLEIEKDDGTMATYHAFRSQHNNARGPYKGGIRFHPNVSKEEVMALSTWMTWKTALVGLPYGGGKGGIIVNPKDLSDKELERLSRAYARFLAEHITAWTDIPAPDVNTNPQVIAWMTDEFQLAMEENGNPQVNPWATFTGKPLALGGSEGRDEATGLGGVYILEELAKKMGWDRKKDITIAVQGFGNVGYWFAHHADALGYTVVAVSDSKGGVYVPTGLNPEKTLACKKDSGVITECMCREDVCDIEFGKVITNDELLELDVDVLVPAALENVITSKNAANIKAKVIIEMANGPIAPEADEILEKNNVTVIPDILANAGGVTVSYFEWVQNLAGTHWEKSIVLKKLLPIMQSAFAQFWKRSQDSKVSFRMAAYLIAVKRVVDVSLLRGRV